MAEQISLEALAQRKSMQPVPAAETENTAQLETQIEELTPEQRNRVNEIKESIDLMDSQAAIQYGVGAQRNISNFADNILTQIRSKDSGYVGDMMSELMIKVKDVGVDKLGEESFLDKLPILKDASRSLRKFMQRYETLEVQIDRIEGELDRARMELLKDIGMFDNLYEKNLDYFRELQVYITAGEEKISEIRRETIPALREQARAKGDPMSAQLVTDFEDTVNRFEKKVHDLKPVSYTHLMELMEKMSRNPARLYGLPYPGIAVGAPADLVLFDENEEWIVEHFHSRSANSPFLGKKLSGRVRYTLCGGKVVYEV